VQARLWEMVQLRRAARVGLHFEAMHAVQEAAHRLCAIGVSVCERRAVVLGVPAFAGCDAGMAANACIEINDEAE